MTRKLSREDETYKFIIKKLGIRFHKRLGYDGDSIEIKNIELTPLAVDNKYMDIFYNVDGKTNHNIELQSSPVYESKLKDMYKYRIYSESEDGMPFKSCIFATYNPNHGLKSIEIDGDINFHPDIYYLKNQNAEEVLNVIADKVKNRIPLLDTEAIDLIFIPDMENDFDIEEVMELTSKLLVNAVIEDRQFHLDLIECQKKMLQRFLKVAKRKKVEKMLNLKAEDFGFEPNVTGFEESVNLAYLDGWREGFDEGWRKGFDEGWREGFDDGKNQTKLEDARNFLELGVDEDIISKATGLDLKTVKSLK